MIAMIHVEFIEDFTVFKCGDEIFCDWCLNLSCSLHGFVEDTEVEADSDVGQFLRF